MPPTGARYSAAERRAIVRLQDSIRNAVNFTGWDGRKYGVDPNHLTTRRYAQSDLEQRRAALEDLAD